jgi:hypothetical protein
MIFRLVVRANRPDSMATILATTQTTPTMRRTNVESSQTLPIKRLVYANSFEKSKTDSLADCLCHKKLCRVVQLKTNPIQTYSMSEKVRLHIIRLQSVVFAINRVLVETITSVLLKQVRLWAPANIRHIKTQSMLQHILHSCIAFCLPGHLEPRASGVAVAVEPVEPVEPAELAELVEVEGHLGSRSMSSAEALNHEALWSLIRVRVRMKW